MKCCNYSTILLVSIFLLALTSCRSHQQCIIDDVQRANIFATDSFHFIIRPLFLDGVQFHGTKQVDSTDDKHVATSQHQRYMPAFEVTGSNRHTENITQHENKKSIPLEAPLVSYSKNLSLVKIFLILFALFFLVLLFKVIRL